ncbi:MAG: glycosyltransferase family 2 protein [Lachnospiraceae bacterium]|nr:glycosyltransferase family 2 protein [Lachnospiraceae bacterium]
MQRTTVVIPNYNGRQYIDACLKSLQKSTVPLKIILVDNGSTDGSLNCVRENYPDVRIIAFPENTGFSKAVNAGILAADTEFVLLLNNDTVVDERMAEYLENAMEADEGCFSAAARMCSLSAPEKLDGAGDFYCALGWAFARGKDQPADRYLKPGRVFSACAGAAIYRRSLFLKIGYFDENHFAYLEDIDIGYRANIYGYPNQYVPQAVVYHAGSAVSGSRHNEFKVRLSAANSIYLIYKNMPFLQLVLNLPFLLAGYLVKSLFFLTKGMGRAYLGGLAKGFCLSASEAGRRNKVPFRWKNLPHYLWIQGQLWLNLLRRLGG